MELITQLIVVLSAQREEAEIGDNEEKEGENNDNKLDESSWEYDRMQRVEL